MERFLVLFFLVCLLLPVFGPFVFSPLWDSRALRKQNEGSEGETIDCCQCGSKDTKGAENETRFEFDACNKTLHLIEELKCRNETTAEGSSGKIHMSFSAAVSIVIAVMAARTLLPAVTRLRQDVELRKRRPGGKGDYRCDAFVSYSDPERHNFVEMKELVTLPLWDAVRLVMKQLGMGMSETKRLGVGMSETKLGMGMSGKDSGKSALGKAPFDHVFEFRRDQSFARTCTACPATVSLVSHFASGTYGQPGSVQELQKEGVRLASFKDFPTNASVSAIRLAQAGFHYTGESDAVKCFSCGVTHQHWQQGDRPSLVHARISPDCSLVRGSDTANLPLPLPVTSRPDFSGARSMDSGYDSRSLGSSAGAPSGGASSAGSTARELHVDSAPDAVTDSLGMPSSGPPALGPPSLPPGPSLVAAAAASTPSQSSLATPENSVFSGAPLFGHATHMDGGVPRNQPMPTKRLDLGGAVYPLYSQMDARKRSFSTWVDDQGLPCVDELITLGFFYAGYADCVRCFFCGIGLKSWEPGDIPAEVHARWRPTCEYLRLVKGDVFVDEVANGGRNVANGVNEGQGQDGEAQRAVNPAPRRDAAPAPQRANNGPSAPSSNSSQPSSAPPAAQVPDIPVVRRARETGYSDQQIAEGIEKLRIIGMERAIEVMLVEVLTNLFRDNPPRPPPPPPPPPQQQPGNPGNPGNGSQGGGNNNGSSGSDAANPGAPGNVHDLQRDCADADADNEVPDNGAGQPQVVGDDGVLRQRHNLLQEENARLRNMRTCQRCHDQPVGVIFLPCGHIIACTTCAPNIRRCLRCDTVIRATANVFFS